MKIIGLIPFKNEEHLLPTYLSNVQPVCDEIIAIDDNSTDNTCEIVNEFISSNLNVVYKLRSGVKSLPLSIYERIENAKYENVLWLDADGSMDAESIKTILNTFFKDNYDKCIETILHHEGGYVNHPDDPGGETNLGVTKKVYLNW